MGHSGRWLYLWEYYPEKELILVSRNELVLMKAGCFEKAILAPLWSQEFCLAWYLSFSMLFCLMQSPVM
jgi:hypothetical protein